MFSYLNLSFATMLFQKRLNAYQTKAHVLFWNLFWNEAIDGLWNKSKDQKSRKADFTWLVVCCHRIGRTRGVPTMPQWAEPGACCLWSCQGIMACLGVSIVTASRALKTSFCSESSFTYCSPVSLLNFHSHLSIHCSQHLQALTVLLWPPAFTKLSLFLETLLLTSMSLWTTNCLSRLNSRETFCCVIS